MADAKKVAASKPAGAGRESDSGLKASDVEACARWLREAWSGLESHDGVQFEKRVSYFRGDELIDRLCALSATPGVAAAREAARDARCAAADAERKQARVDARAAAAAQVAAQRGGRAPTAKELEHDKRRDARDARYEKELDEADAKRIAARRKKHAQLSRKRTFRNAAIEAFVTSERDAVLLATRMMHAGYFHRSQIVTTRRHELDDGDDVKLELHRQQKSFDDTAWAAASPTLGAVYTWLIYPSQRTVWVQSALMALGVIFVCCIKVWPLWLKIVVWWLSLILLVTLLSIMAVRLALFALMWIVGFRGIWLFPNMFEDDLDLLEAFTPLIGRGRSAALPPKRGATAAQLAAPVPEEDGYFQFGGANVVILLVIGVVTCYQLGVFQGENIPEFVISQQDLWKNYGHLLPPPSNTSTWASPNIDANSAAHTDADAAADAADDGADADAAEEAEAEDDTTTASA